MFFKRLLVLMAGVVVFVACFLIHFRLADAQIESDFRQERAKFGVEGTVLTAPASELPVLAPSAPPATNAASTDMGAAPAAIDGSSSAPDPNTLIGPVPPSSATPAATPATPTPDTNAPAPNPPSTQLIPRTRFPAFLVLASFDASGLPLQVTGATAVPATNAPSVPPTPTNTASAAKASVPAPGTPAPATTAAAPSGTPAFASSTNTAGVSRPVPVGGSVIVLGYHQFVGPGQSSKNIYCMKQETFEAEMKYLKDNGYHVIPLSDVVRFIKHEIGVPPNSVAITIDDGYKSAINWAAPVLKQYGYPWTYFVYPDFITVAEGKGAASWNDLLALQAQGVDVESHSMTHPILTSKNQKWKGPRHPLSPEEYDAFLTNETAGSKALLEQKLGKKVPFFAYPYGAYNKTVEAKAIAAGYEAIFTVADNPVHGTTNVYAVGRYIITAPVEKAFASYLRQGALSVVEADPAPGATTSVARPVITCVLGYAGTLDPKSIEAEVRDFGTVRHDFDPKTSTVRLYLPRDLIQSEVLVNIRARDAQTGQMMVANWHFNYEPPGAPSVVHPPIAPMTNATPAATTAAMPAPVPATNAPAGMGHPAANTPAAR